MCFSYGGYKAGGIWSVESSAGQAARATKLSRTFPSALCEVIDNSIAATPPGPPGFMIDVYVPEQPKTNSLGFIIADGGAGMPKGFVADGLFLLGPPTRSGRAQPHVGLHQALNGFE